MLTFHHLGIRNPLLNALHSTFPNIKYPTHSQSQFIPAILSRRHILLQDATGSGKSFGVLLALLNLASTATTPFLSYLLITPHRDLAYQMLYWTQSLIDNFHPRIKIDEVAQVLARSSSASLESQIEQIQHYLPRILIGTPHALLDMHEKDDSILKEARISTIALDEADYLLGVPSKSIRTKHKRKASDNFEKHPTPARILLNELLRFRKPDISPATDKKTAHEGKTSQWTYGTTPYKHPQMIISSATIHHNLEIFLTEDTGWLGDRKGDSSFEHVIGDHNNGLEGRRQHDVLGEVTHQALVISRTGNVSNISSAASGDNRTRITDKSKTQKDEYAENIDDLLRANYVPHSSLQPVESSMLEAIATYFALEVPSVALLVAYPMSSVLKITEGLRDLGVDARPLDFRHEDGGRHHLLSCHADDPPQAENPVLLVTLPASTRGIDIPELTHVMIIGTPSVSDPDVYKHLSGRVGRLGKVGHGKVITFLREGREEWIDGQMKRKYNEPRLMNIFYRMLDIKPVEVDLEIFKRPNEI